MEMNEMTDMVDHIAQELDVTGSVVSTATNLEAHGMFDTFKQKMSWSYIKENVDFSKERFAEIGLYLGLGFVLGFFSKKFYRYIIALIVLSIILTGLHYIGLVTVTLDADKVQQFFGIRPVETLDKNTVNLVLEWCTKNSVGLISCLVGFALGVKIA